MSAYQQFLEFAEANYISTDFFTGDYCRSYPYEFYILTYRRIADVMSIPDNVCVYGSLDYSISSLEVSPKGLHVHGWYDISRTKISVIPCGTFIERQLYCSDGQHGMNVLNQVMIDGYISVCSGIDYILS